MATINFHKSHTYAFFVNSHRFPDIVYLYNCIIVWPWKYRSGSRCTTFNGCLVLTSIKVVFENFSLALTVFEILHIYISSGKCDLENTGQCYDEQHFQWRYSMIVSTSIKVVLENFALALTVSDITYMVSRNCVTLKKYIGQNHDAQHSQWRHSIANTWRPIWWK